MTWPALPLDAWRDTYATLHLWTQIIGKIRMVQGPRQNHSWHTTLYVTSTGLTTSPIPHGERTFQIDFDFLRHQLVIEASDGATGGFPLAPQSVASFYAQVQRELATLDLAVPIRLLPNEVANPIPFDRDEVHAAYDAEYVSRFWQALVHADRVLRIFRSRFIGKSSPVHYFWGAPDLAVTRFSGRVAPPHPGGIPNLPDTVTREAYSHEVSSCGFWPGGGAIDYPAFYAYAYPEPAGFADARVAPAEAFYSRDFHEFVLPYDVVRTSSNPDETLLAFLQSTYEVTATLGNWDRKALERP